MTARKQGPDEFAKKKSSLRYWLLGCSETNRSFLSSLEAMEFGAGFHTGTRKDGVTPEFHHQISIACYLRTLLGKMRFPSETLSAIMLHDVSEDYDVGFEELEAKFGPIVTEAVHRLTKKFRGQVKNTEQYFEEISNCPIASIVKGADRINNVQTMVGVFSIEKQKAYIKEVDDHFLPMLKAARRRFPDQEAIYENIKMMLISQSHLIRAIHEAKEEV